jgi:hypothetical protein
MLCEDLTEYYFWQIMDSVIALFWVDFTGRGELAERQVCEPVIYSHCSSICVA